MSLGGGSASASVNAAVRASKTSPPNYTHPVITIAAGNVGLSARIPCVAQARFRRY